MLIYWVTALLGNRKAKRRQTARMIKSCFKGVDWGKHQFTSGGVQIRAGREDTFYKAGEIDKGISKLNRLLERLSG